MNVKTTYGLFASLLAILGVAALMLLTGPKPGDEGLLLADARAAKLSAKDFNSITIERKSPQGETLTFTRVGENRWKVEKPAESRADSSAVDRIIEELLSARVEGKGELTKKLADAGLDQPSLVVTLRRPDGQAYKVSFGNVTLGGNNADVYAAAGEQPDRAIPIRRIALSALLKTDANDAKSAGEIVKGMADFRSKEMLLDGAGFNPVDNVKSIKLTDGKNNVALVKQDNAWKFEQPNLGDADTKGEQAEGGESSTPTGVEQLVRALAAIKPTTTTDVIDSAKDLGSFGLEPGKEAGPRVDIVRKGTKDGTDITETLLVGKKDDKSDNFFVRLVGDSSVAKVPAKLLEPITKTLARPSTLRERQLLAFNPNDADAVDVKLAGDSQPMELRKVGEPAAWKLFNADGTSLVANPNAVRELLSGLSGKPVKDFPEPNATDESLGFDKPSAEMTLWVRGIVPEEKKEEKKDTAADQDMEKAKVEEKDKAKDAGKDKEGPKDKPAEEKPAATTRPKLKDPTAKLIFGKRDKDLLYVRRILKDKDGKETKADFAISEALLPKVARGRIEYIDAAVPSFVLASAQKLNFNRGAEQFVIEHQDKDPNWLIRQPENRADRAANQYKVEQVLSELSNLRVQKPWSEKPSERELERYGLKTPRTKANVALKEGDKAQERTYMFGAETDDKTSYYARTADRDLVFLVRKDAISALESAELQDPAVFRIDPSKVTGIKLTGWKDVVGQPTTRDLERKGPSNWALRGDPAFKLSAGQAESFLKALVSVQAEKFVAHKSGPKDEHKLTVPTGALEISIMLEGEKDPVTLTIGGVDTESKHYFAMSNKLPGDVFSLSKGIFEAVKAKPGYFAAE